MKKIIFKIFDWIMTGIVSCIAIMFCLAGTNLSIEQESIKITWDIMVIFVLFGIYIIAYLYLCLKYSAFFAYSKIYDRHHSIALYIYVFALLLSCKLSIMGPISLLIAVSCCGVAYLLGYFLWAKLSRWVKSGIIVLIFAFTGGGYFASRSSVYLIMKTIGRSALIPYLEILTNLFLLFCFTLIGYKRKLKTE